MTSSKNPIRLRQVSARHKENVESGPTIERSDWLQPSLFPQHINAMERLVKMAKSALRVQIVSDLHLEMARGSLSPSEFARDAQIVLLAGDISNGKDGIAKAARLFEHASHIIMVGGNHEYWRQGKSIDQINLEMKEAAERYSSNRCRVHFLENETIQLCIEGVDLRISGATLWTDFDLFGNRPLAQMDARRAMSDYRFITGRDGIYFTPEESLERHDSTRRAFLKEFAESDFFGPRVVVTHHAPSLRSVAPEFAWDELSPCFASRLDSLLQAGPCLWAHGHTHNSFRYGGDEEALVVCNPRGYPDERDGPSNPQYDANFVVNIAKGEGGQWLAIPESERDL